MRYTILAILIVAAVFALWLQEDVKKKPVPGTQTDLRFPDYFMENFSISSMNRQGSPEYILSAKKMLHYSDEDYSELELPIVKFTNTGSHFIITASSARLEQSKNIIHLHNNVVIQRAATENQNELSIYTDYLKINTRTSVAETDRPARVKTNNAELNAKGLIFDNLKGTLKLKSQVKGIYESIR